MRKRWIPLAGLIAAGLTAIPACNNADSGDASQGGQGNGLAARLSESEAALAVHDPDSATGDKANAKASKPSRAREARFQPLRARLQAIQQADQKRLDDQAQRIGKLEATVEKLEMRLDRLSQPMASDDPSAKASDTAPADAVSPQPVSLVPVAGHTVAATPVLVPAAHSAGKDGKSNPSSQQSSSSDNNDESSGGSDSSDNASASTSSSALPSTAGDANLIAKCPAHGDPAQQFDVFFQASSRAALTRATAQVESADLTDWFAGERRLYLGRYGKCPIAARRRDAVHERTGLALTIAAVRPERRPAAPTRRAEPSAGASDSEREVGASDATAKRPTEPGAARPVTVSAPFRIVGVEIRGAHHYLGLAPHGANRLSDVSWLAPGERYAHWTLQAIRTDAGTATFVDGDRTIVVKLPSRG